MRDISFRCWNGHAMEYGGFSIHASEGKIEPFKGLTNVTESSPLMQYTGLRDKNGKMIFEGDLIRGHLFQPPFGSDREFIAEVKFTEEGGIVYEWVLKNGDTFWCHPYETSHFEEPCLEVIGNIHQHPELLEES